MRKEEKIRQVLIDLINRLDTETLKWLDVQLGTEEIEDDLNAGELKAICKENIRNGENLNKRISELVKRIGIPAHLKGYGYTIEAVIEFVKNPNPNLSMTKSLYPKIAKKYGTTPSRVERGIRHGVEVALGRGDSKLVNNLFKCSILSEKGKPTNSEFIATLAEAIKNNWDLN